ncbi:MAG: ATP-binding protein [Tepidiformaceae bacterium]
MRELKEILSRLGDGATSGASPIPPAADEGAAACAVCGGAGFVRRERPLGHPRFGKAEPCDCVLEEADEVRRSRLERLSNLGGLTRFTFDALGPPVPGDDRIAFEVAITAARQFAHEPAGWLVIAGASGSGKTHLAAAIANDRIARGEPALFMVVPDLLDHLRASYDAAEGDMGFDELFEQVRSAPLLILDDIDTAAATPWAKEKLFQIINHRYNGRLATVLTHSARPEALDQRLAMRLSDPGVVQRVHLGGDSRPDYRQVGGMTRQRLAAMQFRDFDVSARGLTPDERDSLQSAFDAARSYADNPVGWLTFVGANGCGKTHLAAAIVNRVLADGGRAFFAVVPDLLDHLKASFAPNSDVVYDDVFEEVRNAPLLVLDDLGAQASSPWAKEKLYQMVNYRTLAGLPTVVTTDQGFPELSGAHPRLVGRLWDPHAGSVITVLAPHYRLGTRIIEEGRGGTGARRRRQ